MENIDPKLIGIITLAVIALVEAFIICKKSKKAKADKAEAKKQNTIVKVENKDQKFGANDHYWFVRLAHENKDTPLLFTDDQLGDASERADKNPEDIPK